MRNYTTIQGDTWDMISYKVYGDCKYMDKIIEANSKYTDIFSFSANIIINIPEIIAEYTTVVPPWKK